MSEMTKSIQEGLDIRTLRLERNIRLRDLAQQAEVALADLSKCERGLVLPEREFFVRVARTLSVSPDALREAHVKLLEVAIPGEGYTTVAPQGSYSIERRIQPNESAIPVMDLFCGIGGFSHGFERTRQFQVTVGLDLLPDRIATFCENHPTATALCADIRDVSISMLAELGPKPEVIIGGPPCQGFSSIRPFRTLTEKDPRNNLFEHFALIVNTLKPQWFVLENVVGLLTHKQGSTLQTVLDILDAIGYKTEWKVLNAALYGLPQRRERLVIVGNSAGLSFKWPPPTHFFNGRSMAGKRHGQSVSQPSLFARDLQPAITVMEAIHDLPVIRAGESSDKYREDVTPTDYEKTLRGTKVYPIVWTKKQSI